MCSFFYNSTIIKHHNIIGITHGITDENNTTVFLDKTYSNAA